MSLDAVDIRHNLVLAYDRMVDERERKEIFEWKRQECLRFLQMLKDEGKHTLVDVGSGPGTHAITFRKNAVDVTCVDISSGNVKRCKEKGLDAYECDVLNLASLGRVFDSAFAMNSLLHMPRSQLRGALSAIRNCLNPSGLFYWGQYGGMQREGVDNEDRYQPKRFFSLLDDNQIQEAASEEFILVKFAVIPFEDNDPFHYQSVILRAKD